MTKTEPIMPAGGSWYVVPTWAGALLAGEPLAVRVVYDDLCRVRNTFTSTAQTTRSKITERTGLCARTVTRATERLEALGVVRKEPTVGRGKRQRYYVAMDEPGVFRVRLAPGAPVVTLTARPGKGDTSVPISPTEMVTPESPFSPEKVTPESLFRAEKVTPESPPYPLEKEESAAADRPGTPEPAVTAAADGHTADTETTNDDDASAVVDVAALLLEANDRRAWWPDDDESQRLAGALLTAGNVTAFADYAKRRIGAGATNPAGIVRNWLRRWAQSGLPAELRVQHLRPVPATEPKPERVPPPPARTPRPWCGKCWGPDPSARREVTRSNGVKHATGKPCPECSPAAVGWADEDLTDATTKPAMPVGSPERPVQARTGTDGHQPLAEPLGAVLAASVPSGG